MSHNELLRRRRRLARRRRLMFGELAIIRVYLRLTRLADRDHLPTVELSYLFGVSGVKCSRGLMARFAP